MQTGEHEQTPLKPDTGAQEQGIRPLRFEEPVNRMAPQLRQTVFLG